MKLKFWLLTMVCGAVTPAFSQNLQTVTTNGNTTNQQIIIDPAGDAFRSFNVRRANGGLTTEVALANNKTFGQFIWRPDLATITTSYALNLGAGTLQFYNNGTLHNVWHGGNMGHTSGLDADMLDGLHAGSLSRYGSPYTPDPLAYEYPAPGMYWHTKITPTNGIPENNYGVYMYLGDMVPGNAD
ncbi:hypothetical protein ACQKLP_19225 [Chitinophaga sp. NPDC101104]|uniref:hypothetical protein n=1 Tax=Chitinophaga sp. NPDC101104 TaxID=3390561 RepID=UPI003D071D2D